MKKDNTLVIKILFAVLAVLLIVYFTLSNREEKKFQWFESYAVDSDQPYGTQFIQRLLAGYRSGQKFELNQDKPLQKILDTAQIKTKTDYVLIGQNIYLDEADKNALLNFIYSGNDAFIATVSLPFDVVDQIFVPECGSTLFLSTRDSLSVTMNFYNQTLKSKQGYKYAYRFGRRDVPYYWSTLNPSLFCDSTKSITPLGYIESDKVNFFRFSYGKGNLYIHTNPLVFTNYFISKPDKTEYASSVFSHLSGNAIIWDEFSKAQFLPKSNAPDISPLSYILQHDTLRYAWWLMLGTAVLYILFTAKRKQRIIPVLEEKTNTSLEFVNMVSALHYQNGSHHDMARKKAKYFFYFIKGKYGLHAQTLSEAHIKRLAEKSKVDMSDVQAVAGELAQVDNQRYYDTHNLVGLHNALKKFYKHCK